MVRPTHFAPQPHGRLAYVDTMRAVACLWVVVCHAWLWWTDAKLAFGLPVIDTLVGMADLGVDLFLVLSGFCLALPLLRKQSESDVRIDYRAWITRRFWRIIPPYYFALALFGSLLLVPKFALILPVPQRWYDVPLHLLMLHNISGRSAGSIVGSFWTLALEFQLYVLFPVALWLVRRTGPFGLVSAAVMMSVIWTILCTYRLGAGYLTFGTMVKAYYAVPGRAIEFACGVAAAACIARPRHRQVFVALILFCVCIPITVILMRLPQQSILAHTLLSNRGMKLIFAGVGFGALLVALQPIDRRIDSSKILRPLTALGAVSYSGYLVQEPLLRLCNPLISSLRHGTALTPVSFLLFVVLWVGCIWVPLTYVYYYFAERPFLRGAPTWRPRAVRRVSQ